MSGMDGCLAWSTVYANINSGNFVYGMSFAFRANGPIAPAVADEKYVYIGCYTDSSTRAMTMMSGRYSLDMCYDKCLGAGYSYFAMQHPPGRQCFCSSDLYTSTRYGDASNCDGQLGGSWANSIHKIGAKCETATSQYRNIGCYKDQSARAMSRYLGNGFSVDSCF